MMTSIGGLIFDAVINTKHSSKLTATGHPIESGANIVDHAFVDPKELSVEIGMTDCNGEGVSNDMFKSLMLLQQSRKPLTVQTRYRRYDNMLIMSMSVPDDYRTQNALKAVLALREIIVVGTKVVEIEFSQQSQKAGTTNNGTVQPQRPSIADALQARQLLEGA